jgi:Neocarzinostatin family
VAQVIRSFGIAGALGLAALAGSVFAASSPSYAASPYSHRAAFSVSPSGQLVPGAQVSFTGSGFPPGLALRLEECDPEGPIINSKCTAIADSFVLSGADGSVSGTATIIAGPVGTTVDTNCPVSRDQASGGQRCVVALAATDGSGWYGAAPISFSPSVPVRAAPPPTTTPTLKPTAGENPPSTVPLGDAPVANGTRLADSPKAVPMPAKAASSGHGGPFGWPLWLAVMAAAAAGTGALRAARARRRRRRTALRQGR